MRRIEEEKNRNQRFAFKLFLLLVFFLVFIRSLILHFFCLCLNFVFKSLQLFCVFRFVSHSYFFSHFKTCESSFISMKDSVFVFYSYFFFYRNEQKNLWTLRLLHTNYCVMCLVVVVQTFNKIENNCVRIPCG